MREDVARFVTAQMGIGEGMFAVLKDPTMTIGQLHEKFKQTEQDQKNLLKLNEQLEHLKFQLVALSTKFVSAFGDKLEGLLEKLFKIVDQGADFLIWLNSGDKEAQNFKNTLGDVLVILLQIAPAILAIASAVKILTAALGVLSALVGGPLRLLAAAFIAGQALSIARSTDIIEEGTKRGKSIEQIRKENPSVSETESRYGFGGQTGLFESLGHWLIDKFSPTREAMPATNAPTTNNNTFNIQSNDPKAVANEVSSILNVRNSGVNAQLSVYG